MAKYVFDTYAIIEILEENRGYETYLESEVVINNFIYAELCYILMKRGEENIKVILDKYSKHICSVKPEWIMQAMKFRLDWKNRKVSVPDCVSYIMAKNLGIKFLTGDKEFNDMENVEFVK